MLLTDKVALISGAGRNNGKAISLKFAEEGADLVLVAREREAELNAVVQQCEERGAKVPADGPERRGCERGCVPGLGHVVLREPATASWSTAVAGCKCSRHNG